MLGVRSTGLLGVQFPDWFSGIDRSLYTLFQVMTLEGWSMGIVRPVMEVYLYARLFLIPFILDTRQSMPTRALAQEHIEQAAHQDSAHLEGGAPRPAGGESASGASGRRA
jgi:hypothetical protein